VGAPSSQWIACSAARKGGVGRPLNWVYKDFPKGQDFCAIREAP